MKAYANGHINERISVAGNPAYPAYLIRGDEKNLLIDAGINLFGPLYLQSIGDILGSINRLDYIFITHSHYDHLGALPYLKRMIPGVKIGGFNTIVDLLKKESVLERMNSLSEIQREVFREITGEEDVRITPVEFDHLLRDGDKFDLGGITCEIYETPGHTRDCLSYFIPELGALFPGEIVGVPDWQTGNEIQVEFLSSYDDYLESIGKLTKLEPELIGMAHGWYFTGEDAINFLEKSYDETIRYRKLIEDYIIDSDGDIEKTIETITRVEYDEKGTIMQERNAYITNLTAQVKHLAGLLVL